jgi:hypothetical protein
MRLLSLPITLARIPVELGFGAAKRVASLAGGLVGGGEETAAEEPRAKPARRRKAAARSGGRPARKTAATRRTRRAPAAARKPRAAEAAPPREAPAPAAPEPVPFAPEPPPVEERPAPVAEDPGFGRAEPRFVRQEPAPGAEAHVSEEPEIVAETAEAGAEDGAGAEVAVGEPWPGYDSMQAADIEDRLTVEGAETAAAVSLYESSRRGRTSVLEAASRSMTG